MTSIRPIRYLILAALVAASALAGAADVGNAVVLVAKPELKDALYGSSVLVVRPLGGDQHLGFIVNRPTRTTLGELFPEDGPSQKVLDPVYLGGPFNTQLRADPARALRGRVRRVARGRAAPGDRAGRLVRARG